MKFIILSLLISSCSTEIKKNEISRILFGWRGLRTEKIESHPYFKTLTIQKLKHSDSIETWIYRDQSRFQTSAYCDGLGGCIGMPTFNCVYAFSVKQDTIKRLERHGSCPSVELIESEKK